MALVALACAGCETTNVHFKRGITPPTPSVVPLPSSNRFVLSFIVLNPRNKHYPPGTFKVEAQANYSTQYKDLCKKSHAWNVPALEAETGLFYVEDFAFDPNAFPGEGCHCLKNHCKGGIVLVLKWATGEKAGQKVEGDNTKLYVTWEKSGELVDMKVVEWP